MMRRVAWLFVMALIAARPSGAATLGSHLAPEDSAFSGLFPEYVVAVRAALASDVPWGDSLVVVLPSFRPEWSEWIETDPDPRVCVRIASEPIWNGESSSEPHAVAERPSATCTHLPRRIALAVDAAWRSMLLGVRYREPDDSRGFDGTIYHFSGFSRGLGHLAGTTWSPDPETDPGRLVALAEALRSYSREPSASQTRVICEIAVSLLPAGAEGCD